MSEKELPCMRCGGDLHIPARYNAEEIARLEEDRESLMLYRSCFGDGGDLEQAGDLLREATNIHGVNQTYDNNPYALSEQLQAMSDFVYSEENK